MRTASPPKIDGVLDDPCWKTLPKADRFTDVQLGSLAPDQTTAWVGYDDNYIYAAFDCKDSMPKTIRAQETKRGASLGSDDRVAFDVYAFDTDRIEDMNMFLINPLGTQETSIAGGRARKQEWEGAWVSAAKVNSDGWTVELAIPWRIMSRPRSANKPITMGINFERVQPRTGVFSQWSNLGQNQRGELNGDWLGVVLPSPPEPKKLSAIWYGYGGIDDETILGKAGIDFRYKLSPQQTALLTVNPDFSNVEGDVTSIDFSYAEKLSKETRPFFLEGSAFYSVGEATSSQVINTPYTGRRIPDIDVGAKFFGKLSPQVNAGFLAAQVFEKDRTDAMMHVRYKMGTEGFIGLTGVTRQEPGIDNNVIGTIAKYQLGDYTFYGNYHYSADRTGDGDCGAVGAYWISKALSFYSRYSYVSPTYLPRDGFVAYRNQKGYEYSGMYNNSWRSGAIRDLAASANWISYDHYNGDFYRDLFLGSIQARTANDLLGYATFQAGGYESFSDQVTSIGFQYPTQNKFRNVGLSYSNGTQSGFDYESISGNIQWKLGRRLSLGLSTELVNLAGNDEQYIGILSYDIAKDQSIGGRIVSHGGKTNGYLSYRKSGYGGTEFFVIYGDPNAEDFQNKLVLKVVGVL